MYCVGEGVYNVCTVNGEKFTGVNFHGFHSF